MRLPLLHSVELPAAPLWLLQGASSGHVLALSERVLVCLDRQLRELGRISIADGRLGAASLHPSGDRVALLDGGLLRVHRPDGEALGAWAPPAGAFGSSAHLCWSRDGASLWAGPSSEGAFFVLASPALEPVAMQKLAWNMEGELTVVAHPEGELVQASVTSGPDTIEHSMLRVDGAAITRHPVLDTSGRIFLGWDRSGRESLWCDARGSRVQRRDVGTGTLIGELPERLAGWSAAWAASDRAVLCTLSGALLVLDLSGLEVEHVLRDEGEELVAGLPDPGAEGDFRAVAALASARLATVDGSNRCCLWDGAALFGEERSVDEERPVTRTILELYPPVEGGGSEQSEAAPEREEEGRRFIGFLLQHGAIELDAAVAPKFFDRLGELLRETTKAEAVSDWLLEQPEVVDLHATDAQIQHVLDRW